MAYLDLLSTNHKSTQRDYLGRVNDQEFPKHIAAQLAKQWGYDYWDGDRRINYGGYHYREGYWDSVASRLADHYSLKSGDKVLDIGCGKGFLLYDMLKLVPGLQVFGLDISEYAIQNAKDEIKPNLLRGNATELPFQENEFELVFSINTFHNLKNFELDRALREMLRVSKRSKYICVESYRNELEKANLLYWQVTCEMFCAPDEWDWWFNNCGYDGDHSFIFFE